MLSLTRILSDKIEVEISQYSMCTYTVEIVRIQNCEYDNGRTYENKDVIIKFAQTFNEEKHAQQFIDKNKMFKSIFKAVVKNTRLLEIENA